MMRSHRTSEALAFRTSFASAAVKSQVSRTQVCGGFPAFSASSRANASRASRRRRERGRIVPLREMISLIVVSIAKPQSGTGPRRRGQQGHDEGGANLPGFDQPRQMLERDTEGYERGRQGVALESGPEIYRPCERDQGERSRTGIRRLAPL